MARLGATLQLVDDGEVSIILPNRPEVAQQNAHFHAAATSAIADSAGGYAALTRMDERSAALTVKYKLDLPARCDYLRADPASRARPASSPPQVKARLLRGLRARGNSPPLTQSRKPIVFRDAALRRMGWTAAPIL